MSSVLGCHCNILLEYGLRELASDEKKEAEKKPRSYGFAAWKRSTANSA
jgi:hypothetical protein